jgi:hypothetical protein
MSRGAPRTQGSATDQWNPPIARPMTAMAEAEATIEA